MVSYRKEIPSSLDMLPLGERFGDKNKAKQRARPSAKFAHITSSIDHGKKEKKSGVLDTKDQSRLVRRKGENFGRIAPATLANYIAEGSAQKTLDRKLSDIQVLRTGQFPTKRPPAETNSPKIVLLDLRSTQEYLMSHIQNAISFPAENIQKDQVFAQLSIHKNKADKLLVVYHDDERHGILQARIIFEKGFDNVYLLSGGYCIMQQELPHLIESQQLKSSLTSGAAGAAAAASAAPTGVAAQASPSRSVMSASRGHLGGGSTARSRQSNRQYTGKVVQTR